MNIRKASDMHKNDLLHNIRQFKYRTLHSFYCDVRDCKLSESDVVAVNSLLKELGQDKPLSEWIR
jgi:hypothetical protein